MKKCYLALLLFSSVCVAQQQELNFNTEFYNAVDKWIAFNKKGKDTTYVVGFIYIDQEAGFTFDYESEFINTENGLKKLPRKFEHSLKSRLSPNTVNVAILSDEQVLQLQLPKQPDWLKYYKTNENEPAYLVKMGYHYNHVGASKNAIPPLLKAYDINPHFEGLEFELSFAYNATSQYDKAVDILSKALQKDSQNFWFYRELGFAYKHSNKLEDAEKTYLKGIELSTDNAQKAEMAVNMAQSYFQLRNREKYKEWAAFTRKYAEKNSPFLNYLEHFENNWNKK